MVQVHLRPPPLRALLVPGVLSTNTVSHHLHSLCSHSKPADLGFVGRCQRPTTTLKHVCCNPGASATTAPAGAAKPQAPQHRLCVSSALATSMHTCTARLIGVRDPYYAVVQVHLQPHHLRALQVPSAHLDHGCPHCVRLRDLPAPAPGHGAARSQAAGHGSCPAS